MTTTNEDRQDEQDANVLEEILNRVNSIDDNVEEILDVLNEEFEANEYDPGWEPDYGVTGMEY